MNGERNLGKCFTDATSKVEVSALPPERLVPSSSLRINPRAKMLYAFALISVQGYAPSVSVAPAAGASRSAARLTRMAAETFSEELGMNCEGDCEAVYSKLPKSVKPGVVTGQALVDLLDYAKARRPDQPSHHTTAAHALFCLLSVHRRP